MDVQTNIIASVDLGSSGTRAIFKAPHNVKPSALFLEADLLELSADEIQRFLNKREASIPSPCDEAWLTLGDRSFAVGYLAQQMGGALPQLRKNKVELAAPKVLAILCSFLQEQDINTDDTPIALSVLLPKNEEQDAHSLEKQLKKWCQKGFSFRGHFYQLNFSSLNCSLAEGSGLILLQIRDLGIKHLKNNDTLFVMFGYRNTSCFSYIRGINEGYIVTDDGMALLVETVQRDTPKVDRYALAGVIFEMGDDLREDHPALRRLLRFDMDESYQERIRRQVVEVTRKTRQEYWQRLDEWLDSVMISTIKHLVFAGGGARYLKPELDRKFANFNLCYGDRYAAEIAQNFGTSINDQQALDYRLIDAWGVFHHTITQSQHISAAQ